MNFSTTSELCAKMGCLVMSVACPLLLILLASTVGTSEAASVQSGSNSSSCFEALLYKANLRTLWVPRYAELFRRNGLSVKSLLSLSFLDVVRLFQSRAFNITYAGDAFKLHACIAPGGKCLRYPFCQNGGECAFSSATSAHVCQCARHYRGDRCETKVPDRVSLLEDTVEHLSRIVDASSVVYTRWGKNSCNQTAGAELVYNGYMASSSYAHKGSGSNYLCLPRQPVYGEYRAGVQNHGLIYSVEFETTGHFEPFNGLFNHDPTCSVCRTPGRSAQIMLPASNVCPAAWTLEYHGYLMTTLYTDAKSSEFICMDGHPDPLRGAHADTNGARLYFVESPCSTGLPCPPYYAEKELTCAVCTR